MHTDTGVNKLVCMFCSWFGLGCLVPVKGNLMSWEQEVSLSLNQRDTALISSKPKVIKLFALPNKYFKIQVYSIHYHKTIVEEVYICFNKLKQSFSQYQLATFSTSVLLCLNEMNLYRQVPIYACLQSIILSSWFSMLSFFYFGLSCQHNIFCMFLCSGSRIPPLLGFSFI